MAEEFLKLRDVCDRYQIGPTTVYSRIKAGKFPEPVRIGEASRWRRSTLDAFDDSLPTGVSTYRLSGRHKAGDKAAA